MPRGICVLCGCTTARACPGGCAWIDERHQICSAHDASEVAKADRLIALDTTRTAIQRPFSLPKPQAAISGPLWWRKIRSGIQVADVLAGQYKLVHYPNGWAVLWCPKKGRSKSIISNLPEPKAKQACEQHRIEYIADAMLENAGAKGLVQKDLTGAPVARKKGRGHG